MKTKVKYLLQWYEILRITEEDAEFDGDRLRSLFECLFQKHPDFKERVWDEKTNDLRRHSEADAGGLKLVSPYKNRVRPDVKFLEVHVLVNGRNMRLTGGLETPLKDGDLVTIY